jgi:hypothetical protein
MRLDSQEPSASGNVSVNRAARVDQLHSLARAEMAQTLSFSRVLMRPLAVVTEPETLTGPARWRPRLPAVRPAAVLLLVVLAVQAALSLRLVWSNTAYQDEALYLWAGRLEWQHWLHGTPVPPLATYFSGAPVVYPPLGAAAAAVGGLAGARMLSLAFMLAATCMLWCTTTRLIGRRAAFFACATWAVLGPTQQLGAFATYDAMSLFLLSVAAWCAVRACTGRDCTKWLLAAAGAALLANAAKYASVIFDPVLVTVAGLAACPRPGGKRAAARWTVLLTYLVAGVTALLLVAGHSYELGIEATTVSRALGQQRPVEIALLSWQWIGVVVVVASAGVALSLLGPGRDASRTLLLCALVAAALLVPAEQARIHTTTSLDKHVAFGAWFGAIAAGYAADRLIRAVRWSRTRAMVSVAMGVMIVPVAATGAVQAQQLFDWPNSAAFIRVFRPLAERSLGPVLVETSSVAEYYLPRLRWQQWSNTFSITTRAGQSVGYSTQGITNAGQPGIYRRYIEHDYFELIALNFSAAATAVDGTLTALLRRNPSYRLVATVPYGSEYYVIWQRVPRPRIRADGPGRAGHSRAGHSQAAYSRAGR